MILKQKFPRLYRVFVGSGINATLMSGCHLRLFSSIIEILKC